MSRFLLLDLLHQAVGPICGDPFLQPAMPLLFVARTLRIRGQTCRSEARRKGINRGEVLSEATGSTPFVKEQLEAIPVPEHMTLSSRLDLPLRVNLHDPTTSSDARICVACIIGVSGQAIFRRVVQGAMKDSVGWKTSASVVFYDWYLKRRLDCSELISITTLPSSKELCHI